MKRIGPGMTKCASSLNDSVSGFREHQGWRRCARRTNDDFTEFYMVRILLRLGLHSREHHMKRRMRFLQDEYSLPLYHFQWHLQVYTELCSFRNYVGSASGVFWIWFRPKWDQCLFTPVTSCFLGCVNVVSKSFWFHVWRTQFPICSERQSGSTSNQTMLRQNHVVGLNC